MLRGPNIVGAMSEAMVFGYLLGAGSFRDRLRLDDPYPATQTVNQNYALAVAKRKGLVPTRKYTRK